MKKQSDVLPTLVERYGSKRVRQITNLFLAIPFMVAGIVMGLYLLLWHTDPQIRFIHMVWVLGFWMSGTIAMFTFIIPVRLKLGMPFQGLILSAVAIALAIYFTPLSRFSNVFSRQTDLVLPASVGVLNITICWFMVLRFRNRVIET
jgi:hypothetical protein